MHDAMTESVVFRPYVAAEDIARANFYALIARLFAAPPDAALLAGIASSPPLSTEDDGAELPLAWSKLIAASSAIDEDAAREEYEALFGGVGKAQVNLHASHHLTGFMMEKPLAELRTALATLGLSRLESQPFVEDHLAALCEVMRILIAGTEKYLPASIATQSVFFAAHISPWFERVGDAISKQSLANYYRVVAQLAMAFFRVDRESLAIT
jgi:TorA maturation chaperone TorD